MRAQQDAESELHMRAQQDAQSALHMRAQQDAQSALHMRAQPVSTIYASTTRRAAVTSSDRRAYAAFM